MFQNEKANMQMIFSVQANKNEKSEALSFHVENNPWGILLELINEFDALKIFKMNNDQFQIEVGSYTILVSRDFDKTKVTLLNISHLSPGAAELVAKITDLLFYERNRKLTVHCHNSAAETLAWRACRKLGIQLTPTNDQAAHFAALQEAYNLEESAKLGFAQATLSTKNTEDKPEPSSTPSTL